MRGAEGVVHVEVAAVGELARELPRRSPSRRGSKRVFSSTRSRSSGSSARSARATGVDRERRVVAAFGRPRCEQTRTSAAPRSSRSSSVGSDGRIRVSSATRPSSSGTFRSARTSTPCRRRRPSRTERGTHSQLPAASADVRSRGRRAGTSSPTRCRTSRTPSPSSPFAIVSSLSKMHEYGDCWMSVETSGSSSTAGSPRAARCRPRAERVVDLVDGDLAAERARRSR